MATETSESSSILANSSRNAPIELTNGQISDQPFLTHDTFVGQNSDETDDAILAAYLQQQQVLLENARRPPNQPPTVFPEGTNMAALMPCYSCLQNWLENPKKLWLAYIFWAIGGLFGIHHHYLRRHFMGFFALLGLVVFMGYIPGPIYYRIILPALWWIGDGIRLKWMVAESNRLMRDPSDKEFSLIDAYQIWFPLGLFGLHRFYLKDLWLGFAYLFTLGFFGIGWIMDGFLMYSLVKRGNSGLSSIDFLPKHKRLSLAYLFSVPGSGLMGIHQFYLGRLLFGVAYVMTCGLLGVGLVVDWIRMKWLVNEANARMEQRPPVVTKKNLLDAYQLWFPVGWMGWHQIYLDNYLLGASYFLSLGGFGVAWIIDGIRMKWLVEQSNDPKSKDKLSLKDAFICWLPLAGLFGFHHFYMCSSKYHFHPHRLIFGVLYLCTFGVLGVGWLIDAFLMKKRIQEINDEITKRLQEEENQLVAHQLSQIVENEDRERRLEEDRNLRLEQDLLFAQAMSHDQQQELIRQEEEKILQRMKQEQEERDRQATEQLRQKKEQAEKQLQEYPVEPSGDDTVSLVFQLPGGIRLSRRFYKNQTLGEVKNWVALNRIARSPDCSPNFVIASHFPKQSYTELDKLVGNLFPSPKKKYVNTQMLIFFCRGNPISLPGD
jgi:TM2 domain-containing membrane protein YozV